MAINFPDTSVNNPATGAPWASGDTFVAGSITYKWDGVKWISLGVTPTDRLVEGSNSLEINANNDLVWTGNQLHLVDSAETTASLFINGTKKSSWQAQDNFGTILYSYDGEPLIFSTSTTSSFSEKASIDSNGVFKVGSSSTINVKLSPNTGLEINDGAINTYQATTNVNATPFKIRSDVGGTGVEKLSIKADGDIVIGGTDVATGLQGIKMYLGSNDPSLVGCKADNNPGSAVTLLKLAGYSQSGANFRENSAILFETDAANSSSSASGRIVFRTEDSGFTNGPLTRMVIDNGGTVKYFGATGEAEGVAGLTSSKRANVNNSGTIDIAIPATSFTGHLYVTSVLNSNAAVRTHKIFFVASRIGNSTAITEMNADNGGSGGRSFTITDQSSGAGNKLRFTNTSGAQVNVALFFMGAGGF